MCNSLRITFIAFLLFYKHDMDTINAIHSIINMTVSHVNEANEYGLEYKSN